MKSTGKNTAVKHEQQSPGTCQPGVQSSFISHWQKKRTCGCAPLQDRKTKIRGPIVLPTAPPDRIGLHQRGHWALRGSAPPPLPGSVHLLYYVGKKIVKGDLNTFKGRDFKTEEMLRLTLMLHEFVKVENLA